MKRILLCIPILSFLLFGCSPQMDASSKTKIEEKTHTKKMEQQKIKREAQSQVITKEEAKKVIAEYNKILQDEKPYSALEFLHENIKELSYEDANTMIAGLENIQRNYMNTYTDLLLEGDFEKQNQLHRVFGYEFDHRKIHEIEDKELKSLIEEMIQGGYKLVTLDGFFHPIIDYQGLQKYAPYVSDETRDYLKIASTESDRLTWNNEAIAIPFEELSKRMLGAEKYLIQYKKGTFRNEVGQLYAMYLDTYLKGTSNTPLFHSNTEKLKEEVLKTYQNMMFQYKDTVTGQIIDQYMHSIENNGYQNNQQMMQLSQQLYQSALQRLNVHSSESW